jgi:hypothetical protein
VAAAVDSVVAALPDVGEVVSVKLSRLLRHLSTAGFSLRRTFGAAVLESIEQAISETERLHGGEVRFAIEGALGAVELWREVTPRDRALEVFAQLGVWDTEANNGVLIYVLWADHDVEIVADRGFNGRVSAQEWTAVCHRMEQLFRDNQGQRAVIEGIRATGSLIAKHYPATDRNELPNRPIVL